MPRARAQLRAAGGHAEAHPVLVLIAVATGAIGLWLPEILHVSEWTVMTDELQTVEQALTLWDGHPGDIDRYPSGSTVLGYAAWLAPLYALLDSSSAFTAAHVLNLLLMVSAAAPAYLLTQRIVGGRLVAYLVAALTITVPWLAQATNMLAEPLAYPVSVWAVLAVVMAVENGGMRADVLALGSVAVAFLVEPQLGVLGMVFVAGVLLQELRFPAGQPVFEGGPAQRVKLVVTAIAGRHLVVAIVVVVGVAVLALGQTSGLLGSYSVTVSGDLVPDNFRATLYLLANRIGAGIGFLPFVFGAAWVAGSVIRPADRRAHAYALVLGLTVVGVLAVVTSFGLRFAPDPQERYAFYVAPPLFIATACFFCRPVTRKLGVVAGGLAAIGAILMIRQTAYGGTSELFASPTTSFHQVLVGRSTQIGGWLGIDNLAAGDLAAALALVALIASAVALARRFGRVAFAVVGLSLLVYGGLVTQYVLNQALAKHDARVQEVLGVRDTDARRWVERSVPDDASVAVAPSSFGLLRNAEIARADFEQTAWWDIQFWNRSVDRVFSFRENATWSPFGSEELEMDARTGELSTEQEPPPWLLTAEHAIDFSPRGSLVATAGEGALWRLDEGFRAAWVSSGIAQDGWTVGTGSGARGSAIRVFGRDAPRAHKVSITVSANERGRVPVTILGGPRPVRGRAFSGTPSTLSTTLCVPAGGFSEARIRAPDGRITGDRTVGVRVLDVEVQELERTCVAP